MDKSKVLEMVISNAGHTEVVKVQGVVAFSTFFFIIHGYMLLLIWNLYCKKGFGPNEKGNCAEKPCLLGLSERSSRLERRATNIAEGHRRCSHRWWSQLSTR
jgi:hypothetical protein